MGTLFSIRRVAHRETKIAIRYSAATLPKRRIDAEDEESFVGPSQPGVQIIQELALTLPHACSPVSGIGGTDRFFVRR